MSIVCQLSLFNGVFKRDELLVFAESLGTSIIAVAGDIAGESLPADIVF